MQSVSDLTESIHAQQREESCSDVAESRAVAEQSKLFLDTLDEVLRMRCHRETDAERWKEAVSDDFALRLPITPYRSFDPSEVRLAQVPDLALVLHANDSMASKAHGSAGGERGGGEGSGRLCGHQRERTTNTPRASRGRGIGGPASGGSAAHRLDRRVRGG